MGKKRKKKDAKLIAYHSWSYTNAWSPSHNHPPHCKSPSTPNVLPLSHWPHLLETKSHKRLHLPSWRVLSTNADSGPVTLLLFEHYFKSEWRAVCVFPTWHNHWEVFRPAMIVQSKIYFSISLWVRSFSESCIVWSLGEWLLPLLLTKILRRVCRSYMIITPGPNINGWAAASPWACSLFDSQFSQCM